MPSSSGNGKVRGTPIGTLVVPVRVTFGATGAPTLGNDYGAVTSVARAAAGRYTFTFDFPYSDLLGIAAGAHDYQGTATDGQWQIFTGYSSSAGTVSLSHTVTGSEADPASGNQVDLIFYFRSEGGAF